MKTLINILYVIPSLSSGGAERQLFELIRSIHGEQFHAHVVTLVEANKHYETRLQKLGVKVECLTCIGKTGYFKAIFKLRRLIKENDIQIVHGFLSLGSLLASIAGRTAGIRVFSSAIRSARDDSRKAIVSRIISARLSDVFTANSKAGFDNRYRRWRENFKVIYNGIDMQRFDFDQSAISACRRELEIADSDHCVSMVATLSNNKDHRSFIDLAAAIIQHRDDVVFLVVGDGSMREELERYAHGKSLGERFKFLGYRPDVELLLAVSKVTVLLTNTRVIDEGLSNSVLESMASGVPVIANNSGGTVEIINHAVNGYLIDDTNSKNLAPLIEGLLDDPEKYRSFSNAARNKIRVDFSYEHFVDQHRQIYKQLVNR